MLRHAFARLCSDTLADGVRSRWTGHSMVRYPGRSSRLAAVQWSTPETVWKTFPGSQLKCAGVSCPIIPTSALASRVYSIAAGLPLAAIHFGPTPESLRMFQGAGQLMLMRSVIASMPGSKDWLQDFVPAFGLGAQSPPTSCRPWTPIWLAVI